jgi:predicted 3-demethylubiquinone-9 3-methyltransferase (glyoxalase superfamily)
MPLKRKITPFLWFDGKAEEAANLYVSIFKNSKVVGVTHCEDVGPGTKASVMSATFQLEGQEFIALNGGPQFKFTEAISLFVNCETQEEVDELWEKLAAGGEKQRCGWLKDKFGLSGRSFLPFWAHCSMTRIRKSQKGSWTRCFKWTRSISPVCEKRMRNDPTGELMP